MSSLDDPLVPDHMALNIAPAVAAGTLLAAVGGATFVVGLRFAGWKRLLASVGTGLLIAAAWVAVVGGSFRPSIDGYYIVDQDRIVVVTSGASQGWTRVTEVVESQADVHITVTSQEWLHSSGAASLERLELIVQLADPLAGRTVRDGAGRAVLELHTP